METFKVEYNDNLKITNLLTNKTKEISEEELYNIVLNQELCNKLFLINDRFYKYFPYIYKTKEMTLHMINKYGYIFYELYPYEFRMDYILSLDYVNHPNTNLSYVPYEIIDKEICDTFLKHNPCKLCQVPLEFDYDNYYDNIKSNCPLRKLSR